MTSVDEYRPHHRDDDEEIGLPHGNAIDTGGFPDILVDAAQSGQHETHDQSRALPQPGNQNAIDDDFGIVEWIEVEAFPAEIADEMLNAELWIENPCQTRPVTMKDSAKG